MDYQNTLKYLYESVPMFQQIGSGAYKEGLANTRALDEYFEHPTGNTVRYMWEAPMEKVPVRIPWQPSCKKPVTG